MIGPNEILKRFGSTATPPEGTEVSHAHITSIFVRIALYLDENLQDGREKSLAFTELETASMWAHKTLANDLAKAAENAPKQPRLNTQE